MRMPSPVPGLTKVKKREGFVTWYWSASQCSTKSQGFEPRCVRLWHGRGSPSPEELPKLQERAYHLVADLQDWIRHRGGNGRPRAERGIVYFVRAVDLVKIGYTRRLEKRVSQLQGMFPYKIELLLALPGSKALEGAMHRRFVRDRVGREWFRQSPALAAFIEREQSRTRSEPSFSESPRDFSESPKEALT